MYHARHAKPHHWLALAVTLVAVIALGASFYATGGSNSAARPAASDVKPVGASPSAAQTTTAPHDAAFRRALASCRSATTAQARDLNAAQASLEQWRTHIHAMNQLVAGAITLTQAKAFWSASRTGAAQRVAHFDAMDKNTQGAATKCSSPPGMTDHMAHMQQLAACQEAADARATVLGASRTAISTWRHHIRDMELLRAGKISPFEGLMRWNKNWKKGDAELRRYSEMRKAASRMSSC
jgi:hypothetical protein